MTVEIQNRLASRVAAALREQANWFRNDTGHPPDGVAELNAAADELDDLAGEIEQRLARIDADHRSAAQVTP